MSTAATLAFEINVTSANVSSSQTVVPVPIPVHRADWIIPICINIFLLLLSVYALISLIHFGVKTGKWNRTQRSNEEKLNAGLIYSSVVLSALFCLLRYIFVLPYFSIGYDYGKDRLCDTFSDLTSVFYTLVLFSTALFLWLRQRMFYANRMLNVYYSKAVRFFSKFSLWIVLLCGVGVLIFTVVPNDHPSSPEGCIYKVSNKNLKTAYLIAIVLTIAFGEVTILCLFVHALRAASSSTFQTPRRSTSSSFDQGSTSEVSVRGKPNSGISFDSATSRRHVCSSKKKVSNADPIKGIIQLTLLFATISILVNAVIQITSFYFESPGGRRVLTSLLNISSFMHLLLIVFSFKSYKKMLFSCFYTYH